MIRVRTETLGPAAICRKIGHVSRHVDDHRPLLSAHLTACVRCGETLDFRVYEGRYPIPRKVV